MLQMEMITGLKRKKKRALFYSVSESCTPSSNMLLSNVVNVPVSPQEILNVFSPAGFFVT